MRNVILKLFPPKKDPVVVALEALDMAIRASTLRLASVIREA